MVSIRPQVVQDAEKFYEILTTPNFTHFSSTPESIEQERQWIAQNISNPQFGVNYSILLNNEVVGAIGIKIGDCKHIGRIGYFLEEKHWGKGIVGQALMLMEEKSFKELGITRFEGVMQPKNIKSQRVLIKSGYKKEGLLKKTIKDKKGNLKDVYLYAKVL